MDEEKITIISGPDKEGLKASLFDGKDAEFTVRYSGLAGKPVDHRITVRMQSVAREDGSNENWNISFYVGTQFFSGFYSTRGCHGSLHGRV